MKVDMKMLKGSLGDAKSVTMGAALASIGLRAVLGKPAVAAPGYYGSIPLHGTMAEFEKSIFENEALYPCINIILHPQSVAPWSLLTELGFELVGFMDMMADIKQTDNIEQYIQEMYENLELFFKSDGPVEISKGFNIGLIYDPADAILPDISKALMSMKQQNDLPYLLSGESIRLRFPKSVMNQSYLVLNA